MSLKARILVIDDEPIVCKSCSRILGEEGYEVETTLNGSQGLERMKARPFDVILVDLKMPDMSGMEVLKRIKEEAPETIVLMITGYSTVKTAVEAMKLGASDYVPKPFTPDELAMVVQQALEKRRLLHENASLRQEDVGRWLQNLAEEGAEGIARVTQKFRDAFESAFPPAPENEKNA